MANLEISDKTQFTKEVLKLDPTVFEHTHANSFNEIHEKLLENDVYLENSKADKTMLPTHLKNPYALTVQTNGTTQATYDGSETKTVNITPSNIGAASSNHSHINYSTATNVKNGTGNYSTVEGDGCTASNYHAHAEGFRTIASGESSHVEGSNTKASDTNAHAEGSSSKADGYCSHAEGSGTEANGYYSHAEGSSSKANGSSSHAEGSSSKADGSSSHAEGYMTIASKLASHASGHSTQAIAPCQTVVGLNNIPTYNFSEEKDTIDNSTSFFIVGGGDYNSLKVNAFRVTRGGSTYTKTGGSYNTSGADYGEFFEWQDNNPNAEDRIGYFVTLERDKIKIANKGDYILGAVSGISGVIGNSDEHYTHRWKTDEFGRLLTEQKTFQNEVTGDEYTTEVNIENEDYVYEQDLQYTHRADRKEWDVVGMLGQIIVRDDGTCQVNHYCTVADGGIATATDNNTGYRVIERITDNIIKIIFR